MELFKKLDSEISQNCNGEFAPFYFRASGYLQNLGADACTARAEGIYSLFTKPKPVILESELIPGNLCSLYISKTEKELGRAKSVSDLFPQRTFGTNKDHFAPDYRHILKVGIVGVLAEIENSVITHKDDKSKVLTLSAMKKTILGFSQMIQNYACAAKECKSTERTQFIIENCETIVSGKPESFAQALTLVWFCHLAFLMEERFAMALGRLDQYLYPFYKADIQSGKITDEFVMALLENVFIKLQSDTVNICIGGKDEDGKCEINGLSRCILQAVKNCNVPGPNLSLRLTDNTPDDFLDECLKTIGTGLGYPAIMNDNVNIAALSRYGYDKKDVYDYCFVGCIENFLPGKQPPWTDGRFDTPRFLGGVFGGDISQIRSMPDFMSEFEKQLRRGANEYMAAFNKRNNSINQEFYAEPFLSCFCEDCIGRGLDINCGGSKYPSVHGVAVMGIGTTADSLAAIEKTVFVDKVLSLENIRDALSADFEGYENVRQILLRAPKYGNNDEFADKYAVWFIDFLYEVFSGYKTRDGGGVYIAAAANISNIHAGAKIGATPDGRLAGKPLSDAASPTYGRDRRGATTTLLSVSKPDYTKVACGSVVNQKFSPSMFTDGKRHKLSALIRTYFKKGGQEIQINATSRQVLLDAIDNPEKYKNLIVRVSGFSAYYVTLDKAVQLDILSRTQQE